LRQIFLLLLLLNVGFFAWQFQKENHVPVEMQKDILPDNTAQRLILISELDAGEIEQIQQAETDQVKAESQQQATQPEPEQDKSFVCYSIGPFTGMNSANEVSLILTESGVTAVTRETEDREHRDYWVHLPAENRLTSARRIVRDLEARKISDIYIVTLENSHFVISLGVFRMEETAQRRYSQFVSMGYTPVIEDRYNVTTRFWIDVKDSDPSLLAPELWRDLTTKFPGISRQENAC